MTTVNLSQTWFSLAEGITIAFDAIRANRVRAALTILGIAVGVFVVVIISATIHGINIGVARDFEAAGPTSFTISRFPRMVVQTCDGSDDTCKWRNNPRITSEELTAVNNLPSVLAATAEIDDQAAVSYRGRTLLGPQIQGRTSNWLAVDGGDIVTGRSFTAAENASAERVVLVNDEMADGLFGEMDPIDKVITIRREPFRIIGVYHFAGSFLSGGNRALAIAPYETVRRRLGGNVDWTSITVKPRSGVARNDAMDHVTATLRAMRGLKPSADNNFALVTQDQLFDTYNKMFGMFFLVMVVLSAVGLAVGGVGVVAIMMISVTERTREIGIRKALGATRRMILWQFLVEAITLTSVGALVGFLGGWLVAATISAMTPVPASVPAGAILAALISSAITGVLFGLYPAAHASQLDPVDALRYE